MAVVQRKRAALGIAYAVREGTYAIIEKSGRFADVKGPGPHLKWPFNRRVRIVDMAQRTTEGICVQAVSEDGANVELSVDVAWRVNDADSVDAYSSGVYRVAYACEDVEAVVRGAVTRALSDRVAKHGRGWLVANRAEWEPSALKAADVAAGEVGVRIGHMTLTSMSFGKADDISVDEVSADADAE